MLPMGTRSRNPRRSLVSSGISVPILSHQPWSPLMLQPRLWLDASDLTTITHSGGAVSEWRDKSGNGYAFTQATSAAQPTTGSATQNALNVLSFDGGDMLVSTATASEWKFLGDGTEFMIGLIVQRNVAGANGHIFGTYGGGVTVGTAVRFLGTNNTFSEYVGTLSGGFSFPASDSLVPLGTSTSFRLISNICKAGNAITSERSATWVDGGAVAKINTATSAPSTADPAQTLSIGNRFLVTPMPLNGKIAEIVIVTGTSVTDANREKLHDYLNRKWAIY